MTVKVLITRTVPQEKGREMLRLFKEMRSLATDQPGYISGETMKSSDRPASTLSPLDQSRQAMYISYNIFKSHLI